MTTATMPYFTSGKFGAGPKPEGFDGDWETSVPPGYSQVDSLGLDYLSPVIVLHAQQDRSKNGPAYLIEISDTLTSEYTGTAGLRDAMDLLARWAPLATASVLSYLASAVADPDDGTLPRLIGRIRADEREGITDEAEAEILAARREGRRAWMSSQAEPDEPGAGAPGAVTGTAQDSEAAAG
jgi:hypothetical protein